MHFSKLLLISLNFAFSLSAWQGRWDVDGATNQAEKYGESIAKKYHMRYLNKGVGSCVDSRKVIWDLSIMCNYQWTVDQARPYVIAIIQEFYHKACTDPIMQREIYECIKRDIIPNEPFTMAHVGLKLAFWDKDVNRPPQPYVSRIIVAEGEIRYYMANPKDQSLQPPQVETIDQAMKFLAAQNPQSIKSSQQ